MAYYMDPLKVIKQYVGCKLNPKHYKPHSLELGVVWKYINSGANINGAHDSLVDAKAQTDIFSHPSFVPYLNKSQSIQPIQEIFTKTEVREWKKKMEPERPVQASWIEVTEEEDLKWEPTGSDTYTGNAGGGRVGPFALFWR